MGEWNVLINRPHPQFSLTWIVSGPDAYTFDVPLRPTKKKTIPRSSSALISAARFSKIVDKKWTRMHLFL